MKENGSVLAQDRPFQIVFEDIFSFVNWFECSWVENTWEKGEKESEEKRLGKFEYQYS